jgi:hypothetical protein
MSDHTWVCHQTWLPDPRCLSLAIHVKLKQTTTKQKIIIYFSCHEREKKKKKHKQSINNNNPTMIYAASRGKEHIYASNYMTDDQICPLESVSHAFLII